MRLFVFSSICLILNGCGLFCKAPKLICPIQAEIKDAAKLLFDADTILLYPEILRGEAYYPEVKAITLCVVNGTTKTLDFKPLTPEQCEEGQLKSSEIESGLMDEARRIARMLYENCNVEDFNDIIIQFFKYDSKGSPICRYQCHYFEYEGLK